MKVSRDARNRGYMTTAEFAKLIARNPQTIRKVLCETKSAYGVIPVKLNNRLMWPTAEVCKLLPNITDNEIFSEERSPEGFIYSKALLDKTILQLDILSNIFDEFEVTKLREGFDYHLPERLMLFLAKQEQK